MTETKHSAEWVDFEEVKKRVPFDLAFSVLELMEELKVSGDEIRGRCPLHKGESRNFSANVVKGVFNCFGCRKHGDVIDFVTAYRKIEKKEAAKWLLTLIPAGEQEPPAAGGHMPEHSEAVGHVEGLDAMNERERRLTQSIMFAQVQMLKAVLMAAIGECERLEQEMQMHQEERKVHGESAAR